MARLTDMLRTVPFLQGLQRSVLEQPTAVAVGAYTPGQAIIEEGPLGRERYFLLAGQVEVVKGQGSDAMLLAQRGPGELWGEMRLIEDVPRFATVRALME